MLQEGMESDQLCQGSLLNKLWPDLVFVKNRPQRNEEISKIFKDILGEYDPEQESLGLDESNLDVTDYLIEHDMNHDQGREELGNNYFDKLFYNHF